MAQEAIKTPAAGDGRTGIPPLERVVDTKRLFTRGSLARIGRAGEASGTAIKPALDARVADGSRPLPLAGFSAADKGPRPSIKRRAVPILFLFPLPICHKREGATLLARAYRAPAPVI